MKRALFFSVLLFCAAPSRAEITAIRELPGGSSGAVQFNDGGEFNGDSGMTYNKTTDVLTVSSHSFTWAAGTSLRIGTLFFADGTSVSGSGSLATMAQVNSTFTYVQQFQSAVTASTNTLITLSSAAATYLNQTDASSTYLTKSSASATYPVIGTVISSGPGTVNSYHLSATGVSAGSYNNTTLTVGADGRITAASNGAGAGSNAFPNGVIIGSPTTQTAAGLTISTGAGRNDILLQISTGGAITGTKLFEVNGTSATFSVNLVKINNSGSAANPLLALRNDNTGLYASATTINTTIGGTTGPSFDTSGVSAPNGSATAGSIRSGTAGIFFSGGNDVNFYTGSAQKMVLQSGRLGVGNSAPIARLEVSSGAAASEPLLIVSTATNPSQSQRQFEVDKSSVVFGVPAFFTKFSTYSEVWIATTTSYGATNTAIARFSNVIRTVGNCLSYADSSVLGTSVTVNCDGLYNITYGNQYSGAGHLGVSVNSTRLTTAIQRIDMPERAISGITPSPNIGTVISGDVYLRVGDIVRPHDDPQTAGTNRATEFFHIIGPVSR